jgi:hypothetical protein
VLQVRQVALVVVDTIVQPVVQAQQIKVMQVLQELRQVPRTVQVVAVVQDKHLLYQEQVAVELVVTEFQVV